MKKVWQKFKQEFIVNEEADLFFNISVFLLFVIIGITIYNAAFLAHFFITDDQSYIINNVCIRGISLYNIKCAFTHTFTGKWAPLQIITYMLLYQIFGLNAPIFHIANVFVFTINSFFVYLIINKLIRNKYAGIISGLLYLLAPIEVESIMFASELKTTLANLFIFSSFLSYIFYRESSNKNQLILSICLWGMGLMSKATAFTLPVMFFFYDFLFYPKKIKMFYKYYIFLITFSTAFALSYLMLLHLFDSNISFMHHIQMAIINTAGLFSYPLHQIIPLNMKLLYPSLPYQSWLSVQVVLSFIFLVMIAFIVWKYRKRSPYISFSFLWYGVNFIPASGIENLPGSLFGIIPQGFDHYLPLPYFGITALSGIILWKLYKQLTLVSYKIVYWACMVLIVISMGIVTAKRSYDFINKIEVFKCLVHEYPQNLHPLAILVNEYLLHNETEKAQFYLHEMNKRFPSDPFTYYYNGVLLVLQNKDKDAGKMFKNAKQGFYNYPISDYFAVINFIYTMNYPPYTQLYIDKLKVLKKNQFNSRTFFTHLLCNEAFPGIISQMYTFDQLQNSFISSLHPFSNIVYGCKLLQIGNQQYACTEFKSAFLILKKSPDFITIPSAYIPLLTPIELGYCDTHY